MVKAIKAPCCWLGPKRPSRIKNAAQDRQENGCVFSNKQRDLDSDLSSQLFLVKKENHSGAYIGK
jgi:hypothetical protein